MCTKNGNYCENEKKDRGRGMYTKNGSYCEKEKVRGGGGQGRCERRSEAFVKIQKKYFFFFGGGGGVRCVCVWGGGGGGVRMYVNGEVKLL